MDTLRKILSVIPNRQCKCLTCLKGKTILITGGNSGIGYQTAKILASRGAKIIIADKQTAFTPKYNIIAETQNSDIHAKYLDLGSLASVRQFARHINETESRLDILINNAGVGGLIHRYTEDCLQEEMQINHFGPFLLTHLLLGLSRGLKVTNTKASETQLNSVYVDCLVLQLTSHLLKKSAPGRIIFVTSILAFINNLTLQNLNNASQFPISDFLVYSNSKLCNIIAANGFAEKLKDSGVTSNSVHPGITVSNMYRGMRGNESLKTLKKFIYAALNVVAKSTFEGAQGTVHATLNNELEKTTGKFFVECRPYDPPLKARDKEFCDRIWEASESYVGLQHAEKLEIHDLHSYAPNRIPFAK